MLVQLGRGERVKKFVGQVFYLSVSHFFFNTTWHSKQFELNRRDAVGAKYFASLLLHYLAVFSAGFPKKRGGYHRGLLPVRFLCLGPVKDLSCFKNSQPRSDSPTGPD